MIKNKTLLIFSILGIFLLLIISKTIEPPLVKIKSLDETYIDKTVKVTGKIIDIHNVKSSQTLTLQEDLSKINIFINSKQNLTPNSTITVTGKIQKYNNKLEMEAEKITLLNIP